MGFLRKHWFLIALCVVLAIGFGMAGKLRHIAEIPELSDGLVATTMFLMAWPLRFTELQRTLRNPGPSLLAATINLLLFPLVAWPCSWLLGTELGPGLIILAATPCTLASATVWTRRAGGNDVVSMLVTILTNGVCFLVTPFWILVATGNDIPRDLIMEMIVTLLLVVVVPLAVAQMSRCIPVVATWSSKHKLSLSLLAQVGLLGVVLIGCVKSGLRLQEQSQAWSFVEFLGMLPILIGLHVGAWGYGYWQSLQLGFDRRDAIAVSFSGSQKTLMVGVVAAIRLEFSVIPLIVYHALQLLIDTLLADRLRRLHFVGETGPHTSVSDGS